jgi:hypothetical protein
LAWGRKKEWEREMNNFLPVPVHLLSNSLGCFGPNSPFNKTIPGTLKKRIGIFNLDGSVQKMDIKIRRTSFEGDGPKHHPIPLHMMKNEGTKKENVKTAK